MELLQACSAKLFHVYLLRAFRCQNKETDVPLLPEIIPSPILLSATVHQPGRFGPGCSGEPPPGASLDFSLGVLRRSAFSGLQLAGVFWVGEVLPNSGRKGYKA